MNRSASNKSLPLWVALLVLPILAAGAYLQFNNTSLPEQGDLPVNIPGREHALPITTNKPATLTSPAPIDKALVDNAPATVGLDPETARTAVQQVEDGVYERATAMFEREAVDVEWAGAHEQALRDMFSRHQGLQRVSVNSISCRTNMCRIEVFTPRDADADYFTAMFYDGLANFRDGALKAEAAIARRMAQGMTSVYVARKDHTLGFY